MTEAITYIPNGTVSMTQAFVLGNNQYAEKVYTTPERTTVRSYECMNCHEFTSSRMQFLETVITRNARIRQFKSEHRNCGR